MNLKRILIFVMCHAFCLVLCSSLWAEKAAPPIDNRLVSKAGSDDVAIIEGMLKRGADPSSRSDNKPGTTALSKAAANGREDVVKLLLEYGADVNAKLNDGSTALMWAAFSSNEKIVDMLLNRGADIHVKALDGSDALAWAVIPGNVKLVKLFLDKGLDVNAEITDGTTPLSRAAAMDHKEVVKLLKEHGAKTTLFIATMLGDKADVQHLLDAGADVNIQNNQGWTPLMNAAQRGYVEIMRLLIEKGADINKRRKDRSTAFLDAIGSGNMDAINLLTEKGADINDRRLYARRPDLKSKDRWQASPLTHAVAWKQGDTAKFLIEHGADVNAEMRAQLGSSDNTRVLMFAVWSGDVSVAKMLLDKGADLGFFGAKVRIGIEYILDTPQWTGGMVSNEMIRLLRSYGVKEHNQFKGKDY